MDTQLVERHGQRLGELLDPVLPDEHIDRGSSVTEIARRYRRGKPAYGGLVVPYRSAD